MVDTVGDPELMRRALDVLASRGRLSYMAAPKNTTEMGGILRASAPGFAKEGPYQTYDASGLVQVELAEEALEAYKTVKGGTSGKYVICVE